MIKKIRGVTISVSVYFAALLTFLFALFPGGYAPLGLLCCVLHETGHLIFIKFCGGKIKAINFGVYGMRITPAANLNLSPLKEAAVCFGGPLVNLILFSLSFLAESRAFAAINLAMALFNLLPIESTDGGNILYNILMYKTGEEKAKAALKIMSAVFLFFVYILGFIILFKTKYNFTLLIVAVYLTARFLHS